MSAISESLLDAMNSIAGNTIESLNRTITVEGVIEDVIDAGINLYKIKYKDSTFTAYAPSSVIYHTDDIVYILIPDNDFTKTKIIIGSIAPSAENYVEDGSIEEYIEVESIEEDELKDRIFELCSYHSSEQSIELSNLGDRLNKYVNDGYKNFVLNASFRTALEIEQQMNGNYGLILQVPILRDPGTGEKLDENRAAQESQLNINLDVHTIKGNPYRLLNYAKQKNQFTFPSTALYDNERIPRLIVFVKDFIQSADTTKPTDIFIKDINFSVADVLAEDQKSGYYLSIVADTGNYFVDQDSGVKTLKPVLKVNGKNTKLDGYDCYWFMEDASINTSSDRYHKVGGLGQRCLNTKTNVTLNEDGKESFQYVLNNYSLIITKDDVETKLRYKCVLVKDIIQTSSILTITNTTAQKVCSLKSTNESNTFMREVGNILLTAKVENIDSNTNIDVAWQRLDKTGKVLDSSVIKLVSESIEGNTWQRVVSIPASEIDDFNNIICTFYQKAINLNTGLYNEKNIGTATLTIHTDEEPSFKISVLNADVLYKYDANGNSPFVADYAYPLSAMKTITPISFKLFNPDGSELSEDDYRYCRIRWYVPSTSMIIPPTVLTSRTFEYTISPTYSPTKTDNYINLRVEFKDKVFTETVNLKFVKEGELGTNGSKYTALIKQGDGDNAYQYGERDDNNQVKKLQLIYTKDGRCFYSETAGSQVTGEANIDTVFDKFSVEVYCDGEPIQDPSAYSVIYSIFDDTKTSPMLKVVKEDEVRKIKLNTTKPDEDSDVETIVTWNGVDPTATAVQAEISVGNTDSIFDKKETIYTYYPIEVLYVDRLSFEGNVVPHMKDGFNKVLYGSDCTNPQYDSDEPFKFENTLTDIDLEGVYTYTQSSSNNFQLRPSGNTCVARPITKYNAGDNESLNYVQVKFNITSDKLNKLIEERNKIVEEDLPALDEKIVALQSEETKVETILNAKDNLVSRTQTRIGTSNVKLCLDAKKQLLNTILEMTTIVKKLEKAKVSEDKINNILDVITTARDSLQNMTNLANVYQFDGNNQVQGLDSSSSKTVKNLAKTLLNLAKKYNSILKKQKEQTKDQTDEQNAFYNTINDLIHFVDELSSEDFAVEDFKNFIGQYKALVTRLYNPIPNRESSWTGRQVQNEIDSIYNNAEPLYCSYSDISDIVLVNIQKIISPVKDIEYQQEYYGNLITEAEEEKELLTVQLSDYDILIEKYNTDYAVLTKPIIMTLNRYGLSNINGWDGNKLYIDNQHGENSQYLLAPQLGAGMKEEDNTFTGVVMGIRDFEAKDKAKGQVGLFGYSHGLQSYFLNAKDGSVIMGKAGGGQIIVDPNATIEENPVGLLYSYNYQKPSNYGEDGKPKNYSDTWSQEEGMLIDLTTPRIRFGSGNFEVNKNGHITAKGGGTIAGQNITDTYLEKNQLYIDSGTVHPKVGETPAYTSYGIYSNNHDQLAKTNAGFYLSNDGLSIGNTIRITPGDNGEVLVGRVTSDNKQTISGDGSKAYIAYGGTTQSEATGSDDTTAKVYLGTDGISIGKRFSISPSGVIKAYRGEIGGWTIGNNSLSAGDIEISASGSISTGGDGEFTSGQSIDSSGNAYFKNITCNSVFSITGANGNTFTNAGFNFTGGGTTFGSAGDKTGLNMAENTTKVGGTQLKPYIESLAVNSLTATVIDTKILTAENISTKILTVENINAALASPLQGNITIGRVSAGELYLYDGTPTEQNHKRVGFNTLGNLPSNAKVLYVT